MFQAAHSLPRVCRFGQIAMARRQRVAHSGTFIASSADSAACAGDWICDDSESAGASSLRNAGSDASSKCVVGDGAIAGASGKCADGDGAITKGNASCAIDAESAVELESFRVCGRGASATRTRSLASSYAKFVPALLLFGSNGIVASGIELGSMQIIFFRTLLGTLLMGILVALSHVANARRTGAVDTATAQTGTIVHGAGKRVSPISILLVVASGTFMGISWMFQYAAYATVGIASTSLIYCLGPVLVVATSPLLFGEKIEARKLVAFALALAGIALVSTGYGAAQFDLAGIVFALMCALSYTGLVICNKLASAGDRIPPKGTTICLLQLGSAFAVTAICCAATGNLPLQVPESSIAPILVLGLINTGLGCYLYFSSIGGIPAQSVAIMGYLEPMSSTVLAGLFLGESLSVQQLAGAALIACGALGCELRPSVLATQRRTARR